MIHATLQVFGPANGFKAISVPSFSEVNDDSYALSSSDLILNERGCAVTIKRRKLRDNLTAVRIAAYQQVFEPNLNRLGHAFGIALDIAEAAPSIEPLVNAIIPGLMSVVEENCVQANTNKFLDYDRFKIALKAKQNVFENAMAELEADKRPVLPFIGNVDERGQYCFVLENDPLGPGLAKPLSWFMFEPGGMLCDYLLMYQGASASPGILSLPLPPIESMNANSMDRLIRNNFEQKRSIADLKNEVVHLRDDNSVRDTQIFRLKDELTQTSQVAINLRAELDKNNKKMGNISEQDLRNIKSALREVIGQQVAQGNLSLNQANTTPRVGPSVEMGLKVAVTNDRQVMQDRSIPSKSVSVQPQSKLQRKSNRPEQLFYWAMWALLFAAIVVVGIISIWML